MKIEPFEEQLFIQDQTMARIGNEESNLLMNALDEENDQSPRSFALETQSTFGQRVTRASQENSQDHVIRSIGDFLRNNIVQNRLQLSGNQLENQINELLQENGSQNIQILASRRTQQVEESKSQNQS